jgi:acetyl-CoA acetyltransferase
VTDLWDTVRIGRASSAGRLRAVATANDLARCMHCADVPELHYCCSDLHKLGPFHAAGLWRIGEVWRFCASERLHHLALQECPSIRRFGH